jgi:hypothetical protein
MSPSAPSWSEIARVLLADAHRSTPSAIALIAYTVVPLVVFLGWTLWPVGELRQYYRALKLPPNQVKFSLKYETLRVRDPDVYAPVEAIAEWSLYLQIEGESENRVPGTVGPDMLTQLREIRAAGHAVKGTEAMARHAKARWGVGQ